MSAAQWDAWDASEREGFPLVLGLDTFGDLISSASASISPMTSRCLPPTSC
jgi:hypothetical protein